MNRARFQRFCAALPATSHVVQWGGADVWKVGPKVFAIAWWPDEGPQITFKVSELAYRVLTTQPGLRPAPYLASRGLSWVQHYAAPGLDDAALRDHLRASHARVACGLSRRARAALGLAGIESFET